MFETIIDYVTKEGDRDFDDLPFGEVDSLILCQLSYMKMCGIVPTLEERGRRITLSEIAAHPDFEKLFMDERYAADNRLLFAAMLQGKRFNTMKIGLHVDFLEEESETQFSAITYELSNGVAYVCFRGTDETFVGWKEDFNMAFSKVVPCQASSKKYLNTVAGIISNTFYIGGHSKGGNLAVYSALTANKELRGRMLEVYDHDGPGFREDLLESFDTVGVVEKIRKTTPHDAIVGMIFDDPFTDLDIVQCKGVNVWQHNPYNWRVKGNAFSKLKSIVKPTEFADGTVNKWVSSMNDDQKKEFVDALFSIISGSEAKTVLEFGANLGKSLEGCINTYKSMDDKTKEVLKASANLLIETAKMAAMENINENVENMMSELELAKENALDKLEQAKETIAENVGNLKGTHKA